MPQRMEDSELAKSRRTDQKATGHSASRCLFTISHMGPNGTTDTGIRGQLLKAALSPRAG
jgi:hypothetical protein